MIFVTVGTQAPFDRLLQIMDNWARNHKEVEIFAQIGSTSYRPKNFEHVDHLGKNDFQKKITECQLIASHAGIGSIISALVNQKPIITLPRRSEFNEHRNNHQVSTTKSLAEKKIIYPILTESDFIEHLNRYESIKILKNIGLYADDRLIDFIAWQI